MDVIEGSHSSLLTADEIDDAGLALDPPLDSPGLVVRDGRAAVDASVTISNGAASNVPIRAGRPPLRREGTAPAPSQPPPATPPPTGQTDLTNPDSLSLGQLRQIVQEMPKLEQVPYAFVYEDSSRFEEELEEVFGYTGEEQKSLLKSRVSYRQQWRLFSPSSPEHEEVWTSASPEERQRFLERLRVHLQSPKKSERRSSLESLLYLALGCWFETAGRQSKDPLHSSGPRLDSSDHNNVSEEEDRWQGSRIQVQQIYDNLTLIADVVGMQVIFDAMCAAALCEVGNDDANGHAQDATEDSRNDWRCEQWASLTLMYLLVDVARRNQRDRGDSKMRDALLKLEPDLLTFLTDLLAELRWDDTSNSPPVKLLLLYWKSILLLFGGTSEIAQIKEACAKADPERAHDDVEPRITASPLDYHLFRQEILSKYPAFEPPPSLFPFEPENNSILPPLPESNRGGLSNSAQPGSIEGVASGASILHQPVHIATPAPSPPPSPAGPGGKAAKKHNYQTNQNFPFLYPPLEESSNDIGGKGTTEIQDLLVGKRWEGSDIPTSILEAANLFSKRMRASRAMTQLWEERVKFLKFERGYGAVTGDIDSAAGQRLLDHGTEDRSASELRAIDPELRARLVAVENFYKCALPRLQSVIIVLLKVLLQNVTTLLTQPSFSNGLQNQGQPTDTNDQNATMASAGAGDFNGGSREDPAGDLNDKMLVDLDTFRTQEIMGKAMSGILLLLLKWFKLSHILKFEYLSQLLLDSNYIQLTMKLATHQELERIVNYRCDRKDLDFFTFCTTNSRHGPVLPSSPTASTTSSSAMGPGSNDQTHFEAPPQPPPEVDELGFPTSSPPTSPITTFSWRAFFTSISTLRIIQKLVKAKPHRQLLMVQYKYSNILKKALKVPQPDIRLYTLKIIKGQVPYSHRKWRQSNMRVITAIYLHCKPQLRDEWLVGLDVESEVGEALPLERALRALTYWHNLRCYPEQMGMLDEIGADADDLDPIDLEPDPDAGADALGLAASPPSPLSPALSDSDAISAQPAAGTRKRRSKLLDEPDFFARELERMDLAAGLAARDDGYGGYAAYSGATGGGMAMAEADEALLGSAPGDGGPPPRYDAAGMGMGMEGG